MTAASHELSQLQLWHVQTRPRPSRGANTTYSTLTLRPLLSQLNYAHWAIPLLITTSSIVPKNFPKRHINITTGRLAVTPPMCISAHKNLNRSSPPPAGSRSYEKLPSLRFNVHNDNHFPARQSLHRRGRCCCTASGVLLLLLSLLPKESLPSRDCTTAPEASLPCWQSLDHPGRGRRMASRVLLLLPLLLLWVPFRTGVAPLLQKHHFPAGSRWTTLAGVVRWHRESFSFCHRSFHGCTSEQGQGHRSL